MNMPDPVGVKKLQFNLELINIILDGFPGYLRNHSYNVCYFSVKTAQQAGYDTEDIKTLAIGALLHDIGKSCIDDNILNKPGRLTANEFSIVKQHTVLGTKMIDQYNESSLYLPIILYHHERWDGKGYEGLSGDEIPDLASIVTISDAFDAMTSPRSYQKPKTLTDALKEINENKGTQFAPHIVEAFELCTLNILKNYPDAKDFSSYLKKIFSGVPGT